MKECKLLDGSKSFAEMLVSTGKVKYVLELCKPDNNFYDERITNLYVLVRLRKKHLTTQQHTANNVEHDGT